MTAAQPGHRAPARVAATFAFLAWGAACVGLAAVTGRVLGFGVLFPLKAGAVFAVVMVLALAGLRYHPYPHFGPANVVTTGRAALVGLLAAFVGEAYQPQMALAAAAIGMVAAVCDGVDGHLARRTRLASEFGARFDMETDALLIMVLSVLVWTFDRAGAWVLASGLMRYVFVAAGWAWPWLDARLPPSRRRQMVCVIQVVTLVVVLLPVVGAELSAAASATSLALLAWSFGVDVAWLWRARAMAGAPA